MKYVLYRGNIYIFDNGKYYGKREYLSGRYGNIIKRDDFIIFDYFTYEEFLEMHHYSKLDILSEEEYFNEIL